MPRIRADVEEAVVSALTDLVAALGSGAVEVVDLSAPLSESTPVPTLPAEFGLS